MLNAFLVIRMIFFALLLYLNVLVIVFAAWNLTAVRSIAPGAPLILAANSALIILFLTLATTAEAICPKARPGHVRVECAWTVLTSTLQLAASINVTVNGPPMTCQFNWTWSTCASSSLLVPVTWLVTLVILGYCLTICITACVHAPWIPDLWTMPVSSVPWFDFGTKAPVATSGVPSTGKASKFSRFSSASNESCPITRYITERWGKLSGVERQSQSPSNPILFSRGHQSMDSRRPTWARQMDVRRGVDQPFVRPPPPFAVLRDAHPLQPPAVLTKEVAMSRQSHYVDICHTSEMKSSDGRSTLTLATETPTMFPKGIEDPDRPIPLPHLSQWVRADGGKAGYF
ncbi:hypothetical protein ID866_3694 [Astraeus odoratus]|nr:hypothetical protein ID866_3694 [Astraeus odoratus]